MLSLQCYIQQLYWNFPQKIYIYSSPIIYLFTFTSLCVVCLAFLVFQRFLILALKIFLFQLCKPFQTHAYTDCIISMFWGSIVNLSIKVSSINLTSKLSMTRKSRHPIIYMITDYCSRVTDGFYVTRFDCLMREEKSKNTTWLKCRRPFVALFPLFNFWGHGKQWKWITDTMFRVDSSF